MLNALNEVLRDDFITRLHGGRRALEQGDRQGGHRVSAGLPHKAFHRKIGTLSQLRVSPDGSVVTGEQWDGDVAGWLPTAEDRAFVASLMGRVVEPGRFAGWIAPPVVGINRQPLDFDYVRFD